ncbi:MAG: TatD family hydrolase [bacterium]|nr:TatD family hydrolase [bacterium]MDZ4285562.1 TatD family hydrolase [Candidatus Sungbacteria bacterium]
MSQPTLFDVHTHTHFAAYENETDEVIKRALSADTWIVNVGTQRDTSLGAVETAKRFSEGVFATIGLHPIHTGKSFHDTQELGGEDKGFTSRGEEFDYDYYLKLGRDEKVVAIGECGLDYYRLEESTKLTQMPAFDQQIVLSRELQKPLMIHCRNAFGDLVEMLKERKDKLNSIPGIVHFFAGSVEDARHLLDLGFSFSFGGVLTFARDYDEVVRFIPMEHIVLETDAPYITPVPYRGKRNEPSYIVEVAKKIAELKQISFEEAAERTTANARKLFKV